VSSEKHAALRQRPAGPAQGLQRPKLLSWDLRPSTFYPLTSFFLLASAFCLWLLAYQFPFAQTIHVGGEASLQRREDDDQFLFGENGSEPADRVEAPDDPRGYRWWWEEVQRTGQAPYRWTSAETTLLVPGAGGGRYLVEILARSGRPGEPAPTAWTLGDALPLELSLPAGDARRYRLLAAADGRGDLRIVMRTTPYVAPGDPRELGFVLHEVRLRAVDAGLRVPAWPTLGWLGLVVGLLYGLAVMLQVGRRGALVLAGGAILGVAYCLAAYRPALTVFAPALGLLALSCAAMAALAWPLLRGRREALHILAMVLLAFALRMGGMLHPQALFSDLGFNANNLFGVTLGRVFFTAGLPSDAGGGQAPYPPGLYLLLLPGQLLAAGGEARRLLVQGGTALLDSLTIVAIWALMRRAGFGQRVATIAAACYLLPTPALEAFSIGEYANLGGQALALPLLALLALGAAAATDDRRPTTDDRQWAVPLGSPAVVRGWPSVVILATAIALALLGHSGVTLSAGALVAAAWALAWAERLRGRIGPVDPLRLTVAAAGGLGLALLLYYSAPAFVAALMERGGGAQGTPPLQLLADFARALAGLAPPEDRRVPLPPLIGPAALGGLALLLRQGRPQAAPLRALLVAWWIGTLLTLTLLIVADQGVRWAIFLYPALCIGAGILLEAIWGRGAFGRLAAAAALAVIVAAGLLIWIVTIRDYIHV